MRKRPEIIALVLCTVLMTFAVWINTPGHPDQALLVAAANAGYSIPARIVVAVDRHAFVVVPLFVAMLVLALIRTKPRDSRVQEARVIYVANYVLAAFIVLRGLAVVDVVLTVETKAASILRDAASATSSMPAATRVSTP